MTNGPKVVGSLSACIDHCLCKCERALSSFCPVVGDNSLGCSMLFGQVHHSLQLLGGVRLELVHAHYDGHAEFPDIFDLLAQVGVAAFLHQLHIRVQVLEWQWGAWK